MSKLDEILTDVFTNGGSYEYKHWQTEKMTKNKGLFVFRSKPLVNPPKYLLGLFSNSFNFLAASKAVATSLLATATLNCAVKTSLISGCFGAIAGLTNSRLMSKLPCKMFSPNNAGCLIFGHVLTLKRLSCLEAFDLWA